MPPSINVRISIYFIMALRLCWERWGLLLPSVPELRYLESGSKGERFIVCVYFKSILASFLTILHEVFSTCRTHDSPIIDTPRSSPTISSFDLLSRSCRCIYGGGGRNRTAVQLPISSLQRILYLTNCVSILVFKTLVKQLLIQFTLLLRIVVDCRLIEFLNKIFGFHRAVSITNCYTHYVRKIIYDGNWDSLFFK